MIKKRTATQIIFLWGAAPAAPGGKAASARQNTNCAVSSCAQARKSASGQPAKRATRQAVMHAIAIALNKGGVGKTTLAKHLAVSACAAGQNVLLIDMDSQENAATWGQRRADVSPTPLVQFVNEVALPGVLATARGAGCDLAIIDTPPGRSAEALAAVEAADLVLSPFWLDADSFAGIEKTGALARRLGKPMAAILNFATPNSRGHEDAARRVMEELGVVMAGPVLHRYEVYRAASPRGLTVQELEPESRAAAEIAELWAWLDARLRASAHEGLTA